DSDVSNLATALKTARVLPIGLDIDGIIEEAKKQLKQEADYVTESEYLLRYKTLLADDPRYRVPALIPEFTTSHILAMERLFGVPLEDLASADHDQAERDDIGAKLFELLFRELFEFHLMQTDPNLANYLLLPGDEHQLGLLDFGSSSEIPRELGTQYRALFLGLQDRDRDRILAATLDIGFLRPDDSEAMVERVVDLFLVVFEPFSHQGPFDFASAKIMSRAQEMGMELAFKHGYMRMPPAQTMFLHRKLDGTLMLCGRIKARVDVHAILERVMTQTEPADDKGAG
ncbi:MAG: AarF/ABC1/UbiB kinase family protein, partial [bacterium]|nr:AarF/ABC1/UbiB kinase family protein [bacterium]